jgi:hypothetical protein
VNLKQRKMKNVMTGMNFPVSDLDMECILKEVGNSFCDNHSPTLNSKLVSVDGNYCVVVSVKSPYGSGKGKEGLKMKQPTWLVCNGFWGV